MNSPAERRSVRSALVGCALAGAAMWGCIDRPVRPIGSITQSGVTIQIKNETIDKVDLLVMVDNSNSMRENQANIMSQFSGMIQTLTQPPCINETNMTPHACDATNPNDVPAYPAVRSMHVGVVSSDLGTPGSVVPGCANTDLGDDGLLNPIRYGGALQQHEPWRFAPPAWRPDDCMDPNQFPSFITFDSETTGVATFTHDFQCNAGLFVNGCGLESQLDAVYRALVIHDATDRAGNTSPNAGFLRSDALLAIVMLTDEEDGSVRDCRYANGMPCDGQGAVDVYNPASTAWSATELNLRFYMYQPCGPQDPTWPLNRYVDPSNANAGLLALKPGHPEWVVFAAIAGVPLTIPMTGAGADAVIDWNALLGTPGAGGENDFCGRDTSGLGAMASAEGPISMMQANQDSACPQRVVPACRREGSSPSTGCTTTDQYFAWPSRRVVEVARRFDRAPLCGGAPCENGLVTSVCSSNYSQAMRQIVEKIQSRLRGACLPRVLQTAPDIHGDTTVQCVVREVMPVGTDECDPARGLRDPNAANGTPAPAYETTNGETHRVCDVVQVATDPSTHQPVSGTGWYYDVTVDSTQPRCLQRITFTPDARPVSGSITRLECIQAVTGASDAGASH